MGDPMNEAKGLEGGVSDDGAPGTSGGSATSPVHVPVRYRRTWEDGFGARGWKLALPGLGEDVIAATPFTGERIPTSVFVHDIVDHHLCGFALSGYLDEAGALMQLALRTGSDPVEDYRQMIDEDLLPGRPVADDWPALLPQALRPGSDTRPDPEHLRGLAQWAGQGALRALLVAGFVQAGYARLASARANWEGYGLDVRAREAIALALQRLFDRLDERMLAGDVRHAEGVFEITDRRVAYRDAGGAREDAESVKKDPADA
ncbi:hypothetical protein [Thioalkalivibrio sp. ALE20]|uniref:hypothetical protein n=1 Tax=Thioalkalivibrio sp. ALE20 TaxID=545275 RepID=UPI0004768FA0|nr:hypothetical protein [Thioalkalivibrio sp. ALE20]